MTYAPTLPSASTQPIGIDNGGQPTYAGLFTQVAAQGIAISSDGKSLYISDLFGLVWLIDTSQIQTPGNYNPPFWLYYRLLHEPTVSALGFGVPFSVDVVAALDVGGEANSVCVTPAGVFYVALGGLSASAHETLSAETVESGAFVVPSPSNQVAVFSAFPANGYTVPAQFLSDWPGVPPSLTKIPVGNYPIALAVSQAYSTAVPPLLGSGPPGPTPPFWSFWQYWCEYRLIPVFQQPHKPQVNPTVVVSTPTHAGPARLPLNRLVFHSHSRIGKYVGPNLRR